MRGRPMGEAAAAVGAPLAINPLATATQGFRGAADATKSEAAALRSTLTARTFKAAFKTPR